MRLPPIRYSAEEMRWLEANRMMIISDYRRAFAAKFTRPEITAAHLHGLRKRKGWKVGEVAPGRYKGRRLKYTDAEIAWLRDNCALVIGEYREQFCRKFGRDVSAANLNALRKREGWKTGRTGKFTKGQISHNKGKRCPEGTGGRHPNARKTQFKKGQLPHNFRGPGHESIDEDGYVWIVLDATNPWTGAATWRVHKHRHLWEQANGPVPGGHVLKCLDGNRANSDPSNWELVPIGILPRLNGKSGRDYDQAPAELKPTILAVAKLEHAARNRKAAS